MKKIIVFFAFIAHFGYAQEQNFLEKPYYRTQVTADTLVIPDRIYLNISLSEKDSRGKKSTEELYRKMLQSLQELKVDVQKQLSIYGMSSTYDKKFLKRDINKAENYELLVYDATTALNVMEQLEKKGISNVQISRKEYSKANQLAQTLKEKALRRAKIEAESLLKVVGQGIGRVVNIQEYNRRYSRVYAMELGARTKSVEGAEREYIPDFSPIELQVEFTVVFEIK